MCDGFKAVQAQRLSKRRAPGAPGAPSGGLEGEGGSGGNFSNEEKIELGNQGFKTLDFVAEYPKDSGPKLHFAQLLSLFL